MLNRFGCNFCVLLLGGIFLLQSGCGGKYPLAPVSGQITLDGQPLEDATVTFTPQDAGFESPTSAGRTDQDGKYTLSLVSDESRGALIGKHRVIIAKNFESESDIATPAEQAKAALPSHDFVFEVKRGSNQADFNLERKKRR